MKKKTKILLIISAIIGVALYLFVYRGYDSYSDGCIYSSRELIKLKQDLCLANDIAIYTDFEGTRRAFLRMNRAIELARDGKPYEKLLMEGFRYYRNLGVNLTLDQIRARFKELTR